MSFALSKKAVAEQLGVCVRTVERLIAAGRVRVVHVGRVVRVPQEAVDAFKAAGGVRVIAAAPGCKGGVA